MTAYSDLDSAVAAFQGGAFEYLPKPFDVDQAVELIRRALDESRARRPRPPSRRRETPEILGQAPAMQEVFRAIGRLSQSQRDGADHRRVGHRQGARRARAAPPQPARGAGRSSRSTPRRFRRTCSSRELFGHERGAFTGAQQHAPRPLRAGRGRHAVPRRDRRHAARPADAPAARAVRRRVLPRRRPPPIKANVRVIAATHQNLEAARARRACSARTCYHRLNVDPPAAAAAARARARTSRCSRGISSQKSARELGVEPKRLSDDALAHSRALAFPGNVRQLENLCHWLTVMAPGQVIDVGDLPPELRGDAGARRPRRDWRRALERELERAPRARRDRHRRCARTREFERTLILQGARAHRRAPHRGGATCSAWGATRSRARSRSSASRTTSRRSRED